jgi:hypothetical protein
VSEKQDLPRPPPRTWRPMAAWAAGILLALGLVWFAAAVVVPAHRTRRLVELYSTAGLPPQATVADDVIRELGGPEKAVSRLQQYVRMPASIAQRKYDGLMLIAYCARRPCVATRRYDAPPGMLAPSGFVVVAGERRPGARLAINALQGFLCTGSAEVRQHSATALSWLGLEDLLEDSDPSVRTAAAEALKQIRAATTNQKPPKQGSAGPQESVPPQGGVALAPAARAGCDLRLTITADKLEAKAGEEVKIDLILENVSKGPVGILKLDPMAIGWALIVPDEESVLLAPTASPGMAEKMASAEIAAGGNLSWCGSTIAGNPPLVCVGSAFNHVNVYLAKPGTYKLAATYSVMDHLNPPKGSWTGTLQSNVLEIKLSGEFKRPADARVWNEDCFPPIGISTSQSRDKTAQALLDKATKAMDAKLWIIGKSYLTVLIAKYPDSKPAAQAKKMLETCEQQDDQRELIAAEEERILKAVRQSELNRQWDEVIRKIKGDPSYIRFGKQMTDVPKHLEEAERQKVRDAGGE